MASAQQDFSEEERAAAWAAYYAQQGYDQATIAQMMAGTGDAVASTSYGASSSASTAPAAGYDANGYKIGSVGAGGSGAAGGKAPILGAELLKQSAMYAADGKAPSSGKAKPYQPPKRQTVVRKAGGKTWEDPTLLEWDPKWYRLFVGDVSNDVSERTLDEAFAKYRTYCKSKIVRDRLSQKAKYGFIAFKDPEDFLKAWKEMDGKYVGNRPIRLSKIREDKYGSIETKEVGARQAKKLDLLRKNHGKQPNRPALW